MKKLSLIALLLASALAVFSQKKNISVSSFNSMEAFGPFDIELIKSETESVEIDYKGIDEDDVIAEIQNDNLKLKLKNRHYFNDWDNNRFSRSRYMLVKVYYKDLHSIKVQAGAVVSSRERIKSKYLFIEGSMGAELNLEVLAKELKVESNMGAILELTGQAEKLDARASMGGELKASHLDSKVVYVKASMGADVLVNATDELEAYSSFGANIRYSGGPSVKHTSRSMGGEVGRQ